MFKLIYTRKYLKGEIFMDFENMTNSDLLIELNKLLNDFNYYSNYTRIMYFKELFEFRNETICGNANDKKIYIYLRNLYRDYKVKNNFEYLSKTDEALALNVLKGDIEKYSSKKEYSESFQKIVDAYYEMLFFGKNIFENLTKYEDASKFEYLKLITTMKNKRKEICKCCFIWTCQRNSQGYEFGRYLRFQYCKNQGP